MVTKTLTKVYKKTAIGDFFSFRINNKGGYLKQPPNCCKLAASD